MTKMTGFMKRVLKVRFSEAHDLQTDFMAQMVQKTPPPPPPPLTPPKKEKQRNAKERMPLEDTNV